MLWSYGITTVPSRRKNLFETTLASLKRSGFDTPRLFVDGDDSPSWSEYGLPLTLRNPTVRTYGNWMLGMAELYIREPSADRYAIFQDDFCTGRNLRKYLEACPYPEKGYLNLYTFPVNEGLARESLKGRPYGWYESNQMGKGAVALVFDRSAVIELLTSQHVVMRPLNAHRGHKSVDGGIVTALTKAGWKEYVHSPSLVQHTGTVSSMGNRVHQLAPNFRGETFDCMQFLK